MSPSLPERPNLDQLRRQAKELRDAARRAAPDALARLGSLPPTLTSAQLTIAREYGFASWARLKTFTKGVEEFLVYSVSNQIGRAVRLLQAHPAIATHDVRTAVILGDAIRVREHLARDPGWATRPDPHTGWTPLLGACNSRWYLIDPERGQGLVEVARLLLDAGADPNGTIGEPGQRGHCSPLYGAAGLERHPQLARLLLERGADPDTPAALYHTAFHDGDHTCMRLLLEHGARAEGLSTLGAAISVNDPDAVQLLLQYGIDARTPIPADALAEVEPDTPPVPAVRAAIEHDCSAVLVELLLEHGASPHELPAAVRRGRDDIAELLHRYGATSPVSQVDAFLGACLRADRTQAAITRVPIESLTSDEHATLVLAAEHGNTAAVHLMIDLGFPLDARGTNGATALHAAAGSGSAETVRVLLEHSADTEDRDTSWASTPIVWASVGSGLRMGHAPSPDWAATVQLLIDSGASLPGTWAEDKPPSNEVAEIFRAHGVTG